MLDQTLERVVCLLKMIHKSTSRTFDFFIFCCVFLIKIFFVLLDMFEIKYFCVRIS